MNLLCAECIKTKFVLGTSKEPDDAVTLIEGTAYCLSHAQTILTK